MAKKASSKSKKGKMPAGLAKYWANKRGTSAPVTPAVPAPKSSGKKGKLPAGLAKYLANKKKGG
jgi:hypothetical protein